MKERFLKAAVIACTLAAASCSQAPTAPAPAEYAVLTVETADRTVPRVYSAAIRGDRKSVV